MLKLKLIALTIISLLLINVNSSAQIATLVSDFKSAYISGNASTYINNGEAIVLSLKPEEKKQGQRILTLFKVLTGQAQDMPAIDFNNAMYDVGLSSIIEKNINSDLALISFKWGVYKSYLVFNQSKKNYKFSLKGAYKTANRSFTNNFDGGIFAKACRIVAYTTTPYVYRVASVTELPSFF